MTIHEFGDRKNPAIMLFLGTMCYWKGNFGNVIDELSKKFLVAVVAYTGFDDNDTESYTNVEDELDKIEQYIKDNYDGRICAAYGCSLGGTFVAHLTARHNIHMQYKSKLMQKRFRSQMDSPDPYNHAFVAMTGRDKYDMSMI